VSILGYAQSLRNVENPQESYMTVFETTRQRNNFHGVVVDFRKLEIKHKTDKKSTKIVNALQYNYLKFVRSLQPGISIMFRSLLWFMLIKYLNEEKHQSSSNICAA
jgi:hypothetical protein